MTTASLTNSIDVRRSILWQYDHAPNFIALVENLERIFSVAVNDFWNQIYARDFFDISTATNDGLTAWGKILGVPWPFYTTESVGTTTYTYVSSGFYRRLLKGHMYLSRFGMTAYTINRYLRIVFVEDAEDTRAETPVSLVDYSIMSDDSNDSGSIPPMVIDYKIENAALIEDAVKLVIGYYDGKYDNDSGILTGGKILGYELDGSKRIGYVYDETEVLLPFFDVIFPFPSGVRQYTMEQPSNDYFGIVEGPEKTTDRVSPPPQNFVYIQDQKNGGAFTAPENESLES